jgi:hypothetical protein
VAEARRQRVQVWQFLAGRGGRDQEPGPERRLVSLPAEVWTATGAVRVRLWDRERKALKAEEVLVRAWDGVLGVALGLTGEGVYPRYAPEAGLHQLTSARVSGKCLVDTIAKTPGEYQPPANIDRRGTIGAQERRRLYLPERGLVEDPLLRRRLTWKSDGLHAVLAEAIEVRLLADARALLPP